MEPFKNVLSNVSATTGVIGWREKKGGRSGKENSDEKKRGEEEEPEGEPRERERGAYARTRQCR